MIAQSIGTMVTSLLLNLTSYRCGCRSEKVEVKQARAYADKAQEAVKNVKPYVERSIKEQPMATLAVASVVGFLLGALWKK